MIVAFEIHVNDGGGWRIESIFDEEPLALEAGRRLADSRKSATVRVIREAYDEATDRSSSRVLFDSARAGAEANEMPLRRAAAGGGREIPLAPGAQRAVGKAAGKWDRMVTIHEAQGRQIRRERELREFWTNLLVRVAAVIVLSSGLVLGFNAMFGSL